jgi:hypothetical protein
VPHRHPGAASRPLAALLLVSLFQLLVAGACRGRDASASIIQVALHPPDGGAPASIAVTGLGNADLASLRVRPPADPRWLSLLTVTVADPGTADVPPVQGRYRIDGSTLSFTPLYPFDPGRAYRVVLDPSQLANVSDAGSGVVTAVVRLPPAATEPSTLVTAVYPAADVVAENLLRVYIEFSAPMGSSSGLDFVRLVELSGPDGKTERVDPGAFLPVEADFWSPDHMRYTLFFDPGRVKQGILPNRERGRPLVAGRRYALDIAPAWTDANGLPLKSGNRHEFRAGPAVTTGIDVSAWTILAPAAGSREPLTVRFPRPLDHGILARALGVEPTGAPGTPGAGPNAPRPAALAGRIDLGTDDVSWRFTPVAPWERGEYNLVARSFLEDPQGNQIGRGFEVSAGDPNGAPVPAPDDVRIAFRIGGLR